MSTHSVLEGSKSYQTETIHYWVAFPLDIIDTLRAGQKVSFTGKVTGIDTGTVEHRIYVVADRLTPETSRKETTFHPGNHDSIQRLRDLKTVAISSLGTSEAANLVREKLMNRLAMSGRITVVEDPDKADAGLTGVVGTNIYGVADASAFRLTTKDGRILWAGEHSARGLGSHSSKMADNMANGLLKAIEADVKAK